jgi:ABC-type transporter Mla MlaB component
MIRIRENRQDALSVELLLDGVLDDETLPILKDVCSRHLGIKERVVLNLEGLLHIDRAARSYLTHLTDRVAIVNPPDFMELFHLPQKG